MAETFITQCPHCGTSFRVKEEHLAIANGSVRCGACLQVFSARNHIVSSKPGAQPAAKQAAKKPAQPAAPKPATPKAKTRPAPPVEPPSTKSGFAADDDDDADFLFDDGPDEEEEFIFEDKDDDDLFEDGHDEEELGEFSDHFLNLGSQQTSTTEQANPFQRETSEFEGEAFEEDDSTDESWAESILEELEREEKQQQKSAPKFEAREPAPDHRRKGQPKREPEPDPEPELESFAVPEPKSSGSSGSKASQLVRQINHEIDLDFNAEGRFARWRWLGGVAILVLLVTLAAQFAWMQRDTYAKMDQWRGLYQSACNVLGCTLPAQEDLSRIRTSNVLVRDHKVLDNVKLVDAVLTNRAPFKQPFPVLIIQYTDVNGELVADQAFRPEDYLRGELTGSTLMPMNTRVYVSIPIRDPGQRAVNYQLVMAPA
ncbi:DUF3426 domain-containing protein [Saccharospirillum salsuginis]|nr:DUF3426 domain-containing protein [Saccharospirillum salsuginis]